MWEQVQQASEEPRPAAVGRPGQGPVRQRRETLVRALAALLVPLVAAPDVALAGEEVAERETQRRLPAWWSVRSRQAALERAVALQVRVARAQPEDLGLAAGQKASGGR